MHDHANDLLTEIFAGPIAPDDTPMAIAVVAANLSAVFFGATVLLVAGMAWSVA